MRKNLTRIPVYFEQTVSRYLPVEFRDLQTPLSNNEKDIPKSLDKFSFRPKFPENFGNNYNEITYTSSLVEFPSNMSAS